MCKILITGRGPAVKTTVAGREVNEERDVAEEIANRPGGSVVVGLQQHG